MMNNYQLDCNEKFRNVEHLFNLHRVMERDEKLKYIQQCDSAYTISVVQRKDFLELFEKIHHNAIFIGMKYAFEYVGYAAIYVNDFENYSAYITLICVSKNFQRLHLGSNLMNECICVAKKSGMKRIRLEVLKKDTHAIEFYKSVGFSLEEKEKENSIYMSREI